MHDYFHDNGTGPVIALLVIAQTIINPSVHLQVNELTVIHSYNEILFSNKTEPIFIAHYSKDNLKTFLWEKEVRQKIILYDSI